jgi:hypothetical protein
LRSSNRCDRAVKITKERKQLTKNQIARAFYIVYVGLRRDARYFTSHDRHAAPA